MPKRMTERYDTERIRIMRGELRSWPNTGNIPLSDIVDPLVPNGLVYHILVDVPDDSGLELTVLVDGKIVVRFEIPWIGQNRILGRKDSYLAGRDPYDVDIRDLEEFRRALGQGKARILLDYAVADARHFLPSNCI